MSSTDPRIDAYINDAADFAKPILKFIRATVHKAAPDITETMKWSNPFFTHKGNVCHMAAFKAHCGFGFWRSKLVFGKEMGEGAMGNFGRITSIKDLPSEKDLIAYIKKAIEIDESGVKSGSPMKPKPKSKAPVTAPDDLLAALKRNKKAAAAFDAFAPSHKREYIEWIVEAKRDETRQRRIEQAIAQISEGKSRHWKYQR